MMKTKLFKSMCIFIILCMLSPIILSGCNSGEDVTKGLKEANRKAATITIMTIVGDSTTPEAIAAVEAKLNEITMARYTTQIKLIGLKASEYAAEVQRRFDVYDAEQAKIAEQESIAASLTKASKEQARKDKAAGITYPATKKPTEPPKTTELYTQRIVWPKETSDQIDIFLINSSEMFQNLAVNERLQGLDDELGTKAKVLKEYIHPSIMMAGKYGDKTLAIPTNKAIGTATYIAVNKRLVEAFNAYVDTYNADVKAKNDALADGEAKLDTLSKLDVAKFKDYKDLTAYLEWVKANQPNVALMDGPLTPVNFEPMFPEMPNFAVVSTISAVGGSRPLVYTPEQAPTTAPTKAPTEPATDADGNLIPTTTEDPANTTIPPTTLKPKNIPAVTNLTPAAISIANEYTNAAFVALADLNQEYRAKGLFETAAVPADKERAAYVITGTLEDKIAHETADKANGYEYDYILYANPIASKYDLQSAMYGVAVASKNQLMRCMEIITLLNTNKQFKNTFQYGVEKLHYAYNDNGRVTRLNNDYMMNMDYTGNHFIADLMEGDNPNKWAIAQEHNLNVVNSVFLNFYFDKTKLTAAGEEAIPKIQELSQKFYDELINGKIPDGYATIDDYVSGYVDPEFAAAGWADLQTDIKAQTNPPTE